MTLAPGTILNNNYRIEGLLGEGGFGAVYRAWDVRFELFCAIKENKQASLEGERQFLREAQLLRKLRHPNLPQVTDYFIISGPGGSSGTAYLVMDYIEGEDLERKLVRSGKPLDVNQALEWIGQICDALSYLHDQTPPVIHRDIKPGNIRITPDGRAILVDFGIAKYYDPQRETTLGAKGYTKGFSPYEQRGSAPTDPRSDVYALGATLYCLLTGNPPVDASERLPDQPLKSIRSMNSSVPPEVDAAVMRALGLFARDRWSSISVFRDALIPPDTHKVAETVRILAKRRSDQVSSTLMTAVMIGGAFIAGLLILNWIFNELRGGGAEKATQTAAAFTDAALLSLEPIGLPQVSPGQTTTPETVFDEGTVTAAVRHFMQTETARLILTGTLTPPVSTEPPATRISQGAPMVLIPAGEFRMGNDDAEKPGMQDEGPEHIVYLDSYYMDVYEVTNAEFSEFLNAIGNRKEGGSAWLDVADEHVRIESVNGVWMPHPGYEHHPAVELTWYGAQAFCEWRGARLPTEAEWEKAARGGLEGALYPWGNQPPTCEPGVFNGAQFFDCPGETVPIGSFASNGYGLFDMAGNVWEFVGDWYSKFYYAESPDARPFNDVIEGNTPGKVIRGGAWTETNIEVYLRTAYRAYLYPDYSGGQYGFRCALTL